MEALSNIAVRLKEADGFRLFCHVSPDGDTLGSALALFHALKSMGKRVEIFCQDPVPHRYRFLPGREEIRSPETAEGVFSNAIAIDCADEGRMGCAFSLFQEASYRAVIDHHRTNPGYAMDNAVDGEAAAAGELLWTLLDMLSVKISPEIAECLYVAIVTDTGNFAYSNTRPRTLQICGKLLENGADNVRIDRYLNRNNPFAQTRLMGLVLGKMELLAAGRLCMACIRREDLDSCGLVLADSEGIVEHVRDIEGVELAVLIRETAVPGECKISLRSKDRVDVSAIAQSMQGGGHVRAAGYTDRGDIASVLERAKCICMEALEKAL